ncbi:arrestin domain-containing protein 3-like isoform X2 [Syngnathoides biaculeatus]|uniref:arrestin domain-containing protein 3-like isoform X2 n=1 Tax=Syngnathoides biaculeatus TaxID=300417 RepID=UPI002ADD9801|nr:arrestin domain-containing protein 3-like isoform X2 [Syngnathoides biaculeatus]
MVLGKVRALAVCFDTSDESNLPVFSGGELVSGRVLLEAVGDVRVRSLDVTARGVAKVRWTDSRNAGANAAYAQNYTEELEYLSHRDTLIGDDAGDSSSSAAAAADDGVVSVLRAGLHEFAFSFHLPHMALATSFEGKHGSVRYWVKAELQRPWMLPLKVKKEFVVFEHIDINTPLLLAPQAGSKEKTLCCWLCASGPISLSVKVARKGYTPGDSIRIFAEVENCSTRAVVPKAALYQTQSFFAKGKGKEIRRPVSDLRGEALARGQSQSWRGRPLKIPPVSPSILDCPIIRVEYALVVYVDVPGGLNLSLSLPLVIGTIPLHGRRDGASGWLPTAERPEAPPSYSELAISESHRRHFLRGVPEWEPEPEHASAALLTYVTEFRYLPPPLYAESGAAFPVKSWTWRKRFWGTFQKLLTVLFWNPGPVLPRPLTYALLVDPYPEPADPGRPATCPPR